MSFGITVIPERAHTYAGLIKVNAWRQCRYDLGPSLLRISCERLKLHRASG